MRYRIAVVAIAVSGALLGGCVVEPVHTSGRVVMHDDDSYVEVVFNDRDRRAIHDYYYREREQYRERRGERDDDERGHGKKNGKKEKNGLPPGLAKRDQLPPGLQKQVKRNGQLPPGLEGRRLPQELERQLSPLPRGYVRLQVGTDLVIMDSNTRVTVDVIKDALQ